MPTEALPGSFSALVYFFQVLRAQLRRSAIVRQLKREIQAEQIGLEGALQNLGSAARDLGIAPGVGEAELAALLASEQLRADAEAARAKLAQTSQQREQEFATTESKCNEQREETEGHIDELRANLHERQQQQAGVKARLVHEDRQLRQLAKARDDTRAQAGKQQDIAQKEVLERLAAEKAIQVGDWEKQRATTLEELDQLRVPIEQLQAQLQDARNQLQDTKRALTAARQRLESSKREAAAEDRKRALQIERIDSAISEQSLQLGRAVDAQRNSVSAEVSAIPQISQFFTHIDAHRSAIQSREQTAALLRTERTSYQPDQYRKGLFLLLGLVGGSAAIIVLLCLLV